MALLYGASRKDILMIFDDSDFSTTVIFYKDNNFYDDNRVYAQSGDQRAKGNELAQNGSKQNLINLSRQRINALSHAYIHGQQRASP